LIEPDDWKGTSGVEITPQGWKHPLHDMLLVAKQ
jgi:hypothetical protein